MRVRVSILTGVFEKLSGLKINFHKSEIFCLEGASCYKQLFGCKEGSFPFKYLGTPMSQCKIANKDWSQIEERFQKKTE
jgi:hypothetical protein